MSIQQIDVFIAVEGDDRSLQGYGKCWGACHVYDAEGDMIELEPGMEKNASIRGFAVRYADACLKKIEAVSQSPDPVIVTVHTNSSYLSDSYNKWRPGWKERGWRTKEGKSVQFRQEWESIERSLTSVGANLVAIKPDPSGGTEEVRMYTAIGKAHGSMSGKPFVPPKQAEPPVLSRPAALVAAETAAPLAALPGQGMW